MVVLMGLCGQWPIHASDSQMLHECRYGEDRSNLWVVWERFGVGCRPGSWAGGGLSISRTCQDPSSIFPASPSPLDLNHSLLGFKSAK